tara:strand:+ start:407 stop:1060 length:654 start_codon:yes stop_codon:yes gene_type:complete
MRFAICFLAAVRVCTAEVADPDPGRFAKAIAKFADHDKASPPPKGGIVFTGSSSIRLWDLNKWFPKLKPLNRGFGGAHFSDSNHYLEQTVLKYEPSIVVVFNGSNDVWNKKPPMQVLEDFREFRDRILKRTPKCRLMVLPVKPSPKRVSIIEAEKALNALLKSEAEKDARIIFVGAAFEVLMKGEQPDASLFDEDMLHLNEKGYERWVKLVRPLLKN